MLGLDFAERLEDIQMTTTGSYMEWIIASLLINIYL